MAAVEGRIARVSSQAASDYLGIPMRELKELRRRRKIPFYRIGHRTVSYDMADLDAFLAGCRVAAGGGVVGRGRYAGDRRLKTAD